MEFSSVPALHEVAGDLDALIDRMARLRELDHQPFPYEDVRLIGKIVTSRKKLTRRLIKSVIPDLDTYFMDISGSCSWGEKAKTWPQDKRQELLRYLQGNFFERYPKYKPLARWISSAQTPALHRDLVLHNEMRLTVSAFLNLLEQQHISTASVEAS